MVTVIYYSQNNCSACLTFDPIWNSHQSQHPNVDFRKVVLGPGVRNPHEVTETPTVIISRDNGTTVDFRLVNPTESELHSAIVKTIANSTPNVEPTDTGGGSTYKNSNNTFAYVLGALVLGKIFKIY